MVLAGPRKKKKTNFVQNQINDTSGENTDINLDFTKRASQDSVRAIMLIRAYRIRAI